MAKKFSWPADREIKQPKQNLIIVPQIINSKPWTMSAVSVWHHHNAELASTAALAPRLCNQQHTCKLMYIVAADTCICNRFQPMLWYLQHMQSGQHDTTAEKSKSTEVWNTAAELIPVLFVFHSHNGNSLHSKENNETRQQSYIISTLNYAWIWCSVTHYNRLLLIVLFNKETISVKRSRIYAQHDYTDHLTWTFVDTRSKPTRDCYFWCTAWRSPGLEHSQCILYTVVFIEN